MAYLTATILQNESAWYYTNWAPVIASSGAFTTWLGTIVTRAANHVKWRVGTTDYGTSDAVEQSVLQEMELCYAQYYLCLAAAAIADSSDDATQNPIAGSAGAGARIRDAGEAYKGHAEELLSWWGAQSHQSWAQPEGDAGYNQPEAIPQLTSTVDWARKGT